MIALIMAGGAGTRFWPLSRESMPKQYQRIIGDKSMIRLTCDRLDPLIGINDTFVVTTRDQFHLVREHLPELPEENILPEPFGMNTAPCIGLANTILARRYPENETVVVLPSDHWIGDIPAYHESLRLGDTLAQRGQLVVFGIKPHFPATGYGYIETSEPWETPGVFHVKQFKEKPDYSLAEAFLRAGNFLWNSGMFLWTLKSIRTAYSTLLPNISELLEQISRLHDEHGDLSPIDDIYRRMDRVPVDIGIMEKSINRVVIPVDFGWSDVGGWKALHELDPGDENKISGHTDVIAIDSRDCHVHAGKLVALIGVSGLTIVDTADALLVANTDASEKVRDVVATLRAGERSNLL